MPKPEVEAPAAEVPRSTLPLRRFQRDAARIPQVLLMVVNRPEEADHDPFDETEHALRAERERDEVPGGLQVAPVLWEGVVLHAALDVHRSSEPDVPAFPYVREVPTDQRNAPE